MQLVFQQLAQAHFNFQLNSQAFGSGQPNCAIKKGDSQDPWALENRNLGKVCIMDSRLIPASSLFDDQFVLEYVLATGPFLTTTFIFLLLHCRVFIETKLHPPPQISVPPPSCFEHYSMWGYALLLLNFVLQD